MKNIVIIVILISLFWSCKQDEVITPVPRLKNCAIEYLCFIDDNKYLYNSSLTFPPNDPLKTIVTFDYENNQIIKTTGGFFNVPSGTNLSNLSFSSDVYDSIVYRGNEILVFTKPRVIYSPSFSQKEKPNNPTIYALDNDGRLIRVVRRDSISINYLYADNLIVEKNSDNGLTRQFHFENENLISVTKEFGDTTDLNYYKKEINFQDFDTNPNPFKGQYHLTGAFYRAFSTNNYSSYTIIEYMRMADGKIGKVSTYRYSIPVTYTADGYPKFGDYDLF
ncbi:MAG: hypothetical protein AB7S72_01645 [Draconibacterium sp.]